MARSGLDTQSRAAIPVSAGIGLRAPHCREILDTRPGIGWVEVHSENYFSPGGAPLHLLERVRAHYPVSLHGVGLSLGSVDPLDRAHLESVRRLDARIQPALVSEHLSFSSYGGRYFNDLIPLPYTPEALDHLVRRIQQVQEALGRRILLENPSSYLEYRHSVMPEWEFLVETARRAGCGILLDLNNVYVSCRNHGWDARRYLASIPGELVGEIHLAGHTVNRVGAREILIDTHDGPVCEAVWALFREARGLIGTKPTLIEWDAKLPPLSVLLDEAATAQACLEVRHADAA